LNTTYFWFIGYKIILNSNKIIESVEINADTPDDIKQLIGECYFYRAMVHFDLARVFARPPSHGPANPGVVLRLSTDELDDKARATVSETYQQIISDLKKASELMTQRVPGNQAESLKYASKWAADALLVRAYLYNEQWQDAVQLGEKLLADAPMRLANRNEYLNSFWNAAQSPEAIFAIYFIPAEEHGKASLGSMYNGGENGAEGWGEIFPSDPLRSKLAAADGDVRIGIVDTLFNPDGSIKKYPATPYETFYMNKFSNQDGLTSLGSPQYLRLSEVYLNIAEAYAHLNNDAKALEYVNIIRQRAGLDGNDLVNLGNLASFGYNNVLDAVLGERRLELCFEGLRRDDLLRNKINLDRSFPSAQNPANGTDILPWDAPRQIYFIPQAEMLNNKLCVQNP
jgi:tetratricopeptide (TPR) repeat protein